MYRKSVKIALIFVYLVMIAGAIVRMTGSGMGCPDWPKCFGHLIPPTERAQLEWHPHQDFHEGQVIIVNESLQIAKEDFTSSDAYNQAHWTLYTKHDYAKFNALHTWVEYINRLFGALSGIAVFVMAIFSIRQWKKSKQIVFLSWVSVFLMGFQAWLGAVVVYSVLNPVKITLHMLLALVIVALLLYLLHLANDKHRAENRSLIFQNVMLLALVLTLTQVAFGTQVRQFVDTQVDLLGQNATSLWLASPGVNFYIHRSFSIVVVVVNLFLWWKNRKQNLRFSLMNTLLVLLAIEVLAGIAMYYFDFPFLSQPIHLLMATAIFSVQFYIWLQCLERKPKTAGTKQPA